jgi:hypothetical protein
MPGFGSGSIALDLLPCEHVVCACSASCGEAPEQKTQHIPTCTMWKLIGPDTIDTVPPATLQAFREHGRVRGLTLDEGLSESKVILHRLSNLGINLSVITQQLQTAGVAAFSASLNKLLSTIQAKQYRMMQASN